MSSDASAATVIVPETTLPAVGDVTLTTGGVVSAGAAAIVRSAQFRLGLVLSAPGALTNPPGGTPRWYWKSTPSGPTDVQMSRDSSVHSGCLISKVTVPPEIAPAATV